MSPLAFLVAALATHLAALQPSSSAPTFTKHVAPIIFARCADCHRPGEAAPMSLLTYQDARPWSRAIKQQVVTRQMPPWHADPSNSLRFRNDLRLTDEEINTIVAWVDAGAAKGDEADLPPVPRFTRGWQRGEPDYVIEVPVDFEMPADGQIDLQNFYVKVPFDRDVFADALEIRPSAPGVLHHGGAYIVDLPEGTRIVNGRAFRPDGTPLGRDEAPRVGESRFDTVGAAKLVSYVPGRGLVQYPAGTGKRVPAGKYIHFDLHYQPTGRPEKDRVRVGLWFSRTPVRREILSRAISSHWIVEGKEAREEIILVGGKPRVTELIPNIPPYAENWKIVGVEPIPEAVTLYAVSPHMHLRGKDFKYIVTFPDGRETTILSVPRYDFNWQLNYELETPLRIPAGSKVISIAHFDNSPRNRYNPAPEKWVFWGVQSWEEMNVGMMELTLDRQDF
jgi:hypothetical protein